MTSGKEFLAILAIATGSLAGAARADVYCVGQVSEFLVFDNGSLTILAPWRNDWTVLCNTQGTWKAIAGETCFSWLAMLGAAKSHNKQVGIYYGGNHDCATLATYMNAPPPAYVRALP